MMMSNLGGSTAGNKTNDAAIDVQKYSNHLLLSVNQVLEELKSDNYKTNEIKKYEFIISWVKHDTNFRSQFLSRLMKHITMSMIPVSYFISNIENEEVLKVNCKDLLYDSLLVYSHQYLKWITDHDHAYKIPILIITTSFYAENGKINHCLEWINSEYKKNVSPLPEQFKWDGSKSQSIVLSDGRIFSMNNNNCSTSWCGKIFDGNKKQWNSTSIIQNGYYCYTISLRELNGYIYGMCIDGHFKRYRIKNNTWQNLKGLENNPNFSFSFNGLIVFDGHIYNVGDLGVLKYTPKIDTWQLISQECQNLGINAASCSLDGFLYFMGLSENERSAVKFDLSTNTWSNIANMNVERAYAGAIVVNGLIYVIGGYDCDSFEIYDPEQNTWTLSTSKLISKKHFRTNAYFFPPNTNINLENISNYYSLKKKK